MSEISQSEAATQTVDPESYAVILRDHFDWPYWREGNPRSTRFVTTECDYSILGGVTECTPLQWVQCKRKEKQEFAVQISDTKKGRKERNKDRLSVFIVSKDTKKQRKEEISIKTAAQDLICGKWGVFNILIRGVMQ